MVGECKAIGRLGDSNADDFACVQEKGGVLLGNGARCPSVAAAFNELASFHDGKPALNFRCSFAGGLYVKDDCEGKVARVNEAVDSHGKGHFSCEHTTSTVTTTSTSTSASTSTSTSAMPQKGLAKCHSVEPKGALFSFDGMAKCTSQVAHIKG